MTNIPVNQCCLFVCFFQYSMSLFFLLTLPFFFFLPATRQTPPECRKTCRLSSRPFSQFLMKWRTTCWRVSNRREPPAHMSSRYWPHFPQLPITGQTHSLHWSLWFIWCEIKIIKPNVPQYSNLKIDLLEVNRISMNHIYLQQF